MYDATSINVLSQKKWSSYGQTGCYAYDYHLLQHLSYKFANYEHLQLYHQ